MSSWGFLGISTNHYCQTSLRQSCETCVTFGGKGRKKKDEISGRAGEGRGLYVTFMSTDTTFQVQPPLPLDGKVGQARIRQRK